LASVSASFPAALSLREAEARRVLARGLLFVTVRTDVALLARHTEALVELYKPG
jgi:2-keto-3-deoxy-L-rhamnonate aldolase RhmA